MQQPEYKTRPGLLVWGGAPRRNRTGDPILTIDARDVHNASQLLASPHNRAGGKTLPRVGWWGGVRLRVAQFLANLWQGTLRVVCGTNAGPILSAVSTTGDWNPPVHRCPWTITGRP
jgi:hypothetical protein